MESKTRVLYLYAGSRGGYYSNFLVGDMPDTRLLGLNYMSQLGIDAEFLEIPLAQWLRKINFNLTHIPYLAYLRKYDLVFMGSGLPLIILARQLLGWKRPKLVLFNTYFSNLLRRHKRGWTGLLIRSALRNTDAIVCISTSQKNDLIAQGVDPNRVWFLPIGIDVTHIRQEPSGEEFVLSVGKDLARDYRTLFAAVEGLSIPVRVVALPCNVEGLRIPKNVQVSLDIPYQELPDLYRRSRLVVVPVRKEEAALGSDASGQYGYLEPMGYGKPVVVSDRASARDYISHERDGILVPAEDSAALRKAILDLWNDPVECKRLGSAARNKVAIEYSTSRFAERLAEIFTVVLKSSEPARPHP